MIKLPYLLIGTWRDSNTNIRDKEYYQLRSQEGFGKKLDEVNNKKYIKKIF